MYMLTPSGLKLSASALWKFLLRLVVLLVGEMLHVDDVHVLDCVNGAEAGRRNGSRLVGPLRGVEGTTSGEGSGE